MDTGTLISVDEGIMHDERFAVNALLKNKNEEEEEEEDEDEDKKRQKMMKREKINEKRWRR